MRGEWQQGRLGEIAEVVMGTSPPGTTCNTIGEGVPLLNGPSEFNTRHPIPVQFTTAPRRMSRPGDILFCVRGSTTGRMNWSDREYSIGRGLAAIRHKSIPKCQPLLRALIEYRLPDLLAVATGSTFPCVSRDDIVALPCLLPPVDEQIEIARILGAIDDKVSVDHKINTTLEEMSRGLFKSWFVDFDPVTARAAGRRPAHMSGATAALFPDCFVDSDLGRIPKGWTTGALRKIADVIMGTSPPGDSYNDLGMGTPLINGPVEYGDYFPKKIKWTTQPSRLCEPNDLIFCVRGSTTGRRVIADDVYCLGRGVCAIRAKNGHQGFIDLAVENTLDMLLTRATGSTFPSLNGPEIKGCDVLIPSDSVLSVFAKRVNPWREQIRANVREAELLVRTRDALLPQLLSGAIRLRQAEKLVEEVV